MEMKTEIYFKQLLPTVKHFVYHPWVVKSGLSPDQIQNIQCIESIARD